MEQENIAKGSY